MFTINDDNSIYATRGDIVFFYVSAEDNGVSYVFQPGDIVRIKVYGKKDAENVVLQKDFPVTDESVQVEIFLTEEDTKIGEVISKPRDYWYEVELNPDTNPQTFIGYDEDGAKVFRLFPEGDDIPPYVPDIKPEDIPIVDDTLDLTSTRPIQNQAVARVLADLTSDVAKLSKRLLTPQMCGAKGDGVTDDTEALRAAAVACTESGVSLYIPAGDYLISDTIDLSAVPTVEGEGRLVYTGDDVAVLVCPGERTAKFKHRLNVMSKDGRHTGTGILLKNVGCSFFDVSAVGFAVGLELLGDGEGCGYNTVYPRQIASNHVAIKLNSKNNGWCNQNIFISGRVFKWSTDTFDMTGILITSECGYYSNSNVFYSTNLEGSCKYVIHAEYGQYNRFCEIRNEGCETTLLESNESMCNTVTVSYGSNDDHINNSKYIGSSIVPFRNRHLPKYRQVFNCEEVAKKVYHTSNRVTSSVFKLMTYEGAVDIVSSVRLDVSGDYIHSEAFPCLALKLDPAVGNRYYITLNCKEDYTGRFAIVAYDKTGAFITNQPIKPRVNENMAMVEASGLVYFQTQTDGKDSIEFEVTDSNVSELYVFFKGGTNALYLRGVTVFATGDGRVINDVVPQLNGIPTNAGCFGDMVKSSTDNSVAWVMLDTWRAVTV